MTDRKLQTYIQSLEKIDTSELYGKDFLLTWEKGAQELEAVFHTADILKIMHAGGIPAQIFKSGMAVSIFRDKSTRTRFSFAGAANLLGLQVQDLDEEKSQIAHGETVRETAVMISFLTEVIGIRDDMFIGEGNRYMREVAAAVEDAYNQGILHRRPSLVNLQCDLDHPTQSMADLLHLRHFEGSPEKLAGKKVAMSWAYSPSYGKPLSVPQGIITLFTRYGMDVVLAHPPGYNLLEDTLRTAEKHADLSGGSFRVTTNMKDAFEDADIVYPKSWAPFSVMEKRTELLGAGDKDGLKKLETRCLEENRRYIDWHCDDDLMALTKGGKALYMHCLPADISGVSCQQGEVSSSVFEKYRNQTYLEAGNKPFIIAAMMLLSKVKDPAAVLSDLVKKAL
ncbi:MAG: knotted carbamoyltransferase YgeW [Spirochaetales bacterium]|nr:knotted carbamoyltransferase YgeW [Spirochaetales bacterium]